MASPIWKPTLRTGFSEVIGSWNTIETSEPRTCRSSFFDIFSRSLPLKYASPRTILPGGCGMSPRIDIVLTLLPEPDSPTMPSVSPGYTSYVIPSTACTMPSSVVNCTARSRIERIGSTADGLTAHESHHSVATHEFGAGSDPKRLGGRHR